MNKSDIEFTIGLNTSPAEQKLNELDDKVKASGHIYNDIFKDVGQGFKMVGTPYQNSNNYGVPSVQVLERSVAVFSNVMERFARIVESTSAQMVNFTTVGRAYTPQNGPINMGSKVAGYLPHYYPSALSEFYNSRPLGLPSPDYAINANDIFDAIIKRRKAQEASFSPIYSTAFEQFAKTMNPYGTMNLYGMYETWKNNFSFNMLGLPAPKENEKKKDTFDISIDKQVTEEDKKDNIELGEKLRKWGKIFAIVYGVRKLLEGMSKLWKLDAETVSSVNQNINNQLGYFSVDPVSALNANVDKTRSLWYEGVRNMGENSPVSKAGLDEMAQKFTNMWTAAMSGRQVDTQTTIDAQRLKEFFGFDYTVAGLLTGQREGKSATDIQRDAIIKVENQISKLAEVDEIQRGQLIDSLRNLFGDEMINAIVANFNKRLRSDSYDRTVIEQIEHYGNSTFGTKDLTDKTINTTNALSDLKASLSNLKNTIVEDTAPAFTAVTKAMTSVVEWANKTLTGAKGDKDETGAFIGAGPEVSKSTKKGYGQSKAEKKETADNFDITERLKNASSIYDVADVIYKTNPLTKNVADAEAIKQARYQRQLGKAIASGKLNPNSNNEIISSLASYEYGGKTGLEAFRLAIKEGAVDLGSFANNPLLNKLFFSPDSMSEREILAATNLLPQIPYFSNLFYKTFGEGGPEDLSADMSYGKYLLGEEDFDNPEEWYEYMKSFFTSINRNKWGRDYVKSSGYESEKKADKNKNNVLDWGEVRAAFKITLTDQFGRTLGFEEKTVSSVQ